MSCRVKRINNQITEVLAPTGANSLIYQSIVDNLSPADIQHLTENNSYIKAKIEDGTIRDTSTAEIALGVWSFMYTPEFKEVYGEWENGDSNVNTQGEPNVSMKDLIYNKGGVRSNFSTSSLGAAVSDKIYEFLSKVGISVSNMDNYKSSLAARGLDFNTSGVNAVTDLSNGVIALAEGATEYDFVEEVGHVAVHLMPRDKKFYRALELVKNTDEYKKNVEGYTQNYTQLSLDLNEEVNTDEISEKVAIEVMGKLVAPNLFNNQKTVEFRLLKTLEGLWNQFKKLFTNNLNETTELNNYLNSVANQINSNELNRDVLSDFSSKSIYFSTKEEKVAQKLLKQVIESLEGRLKSRRKRSVGKKLSLKIQDEIDVLKRELNRAKEEEGLFNFIEFLKDDLRDAVSYIESVKNNKQILEVNKLMELKEFINYYDPLIRQLNKHNSYSPLFSSLAKGRQEYMTDIIKDLMVEISNVNDFYIDSHGVAVEKEMTNWFTENGLNIDFDIKAAFSNLTKDVNIVQWFSGLLRDVGNPIGRVIYAMTVKTQQKVAREATDQSRDMVNKVLNDLGVKDTSKLVEKKDGKNTRYFLTQYNLSDFYEAYDKFTDKLREKYKLDEGQKEPFDLKELVKFRKEKNDFLSKNIERRYKKEYYDLRDKLSVEAQEAQLFMDVQIADLTSRIRNEEGNIDYYNLSDEQFTEIQELQIARKGLAKVFHEDGTKKTGQALQIAEELSEFNKALEGKRQFKSKMEEWKTAAAVMQRALSKEEYKKWVERNSELIYEESFWDKLNEIEAREYPENIKALTDKRKEILGRYKNTIGAAEFDLIPEHTMEVIKEIDLTLQELFSQYFKDNPNFEESSFKDVASIIATPQFTAAQEKAKAEGKEDAFINQHYYKDNRGKLKPYSYGTHIVPLDRSLVGRQSKWSELSEKSELYNPKFDENWVGLQPSSKWESREYQQLFSNEKAALKELLKIKHNMDSKLPISRRNAYMLPQISKSFNDLVKDKELNMETIGELLKDSWTSRVDDTDYGMKLDRKDGSQRNHVPYYYTSKLENPANVSSDVLASMALYIKMALNYQEMAKIAPKLEAIKEEFDRAEFVKGNTVEKAGASKLSDMMKVFMEMQIYGIKKTDSGEVNIPVINKRVNVNKIASNINSFIRAVNLMGNIATVSAGYINGLVNSKIEDFVGKYTTNLSKGLAMKEFASQVFGATLELKSINKSNKLNKVLEHFRVVVDYDNVFDNLDKDKLGRMKREDLVYFGFGMADFNLKSHIALAVLFNYRMFNNKFYTEAEFKRLKKMGEGNSQLGVTKYTDLTTVYDMFEVDNYKLVVKKEFKDRVKESDLDYLEYTMNALAAKSDGVLTPADRAKIHQGTWSQLVATHRSWLIDTFSRRWKAKGTNYMTREVEIGSHREFISLMYKTILEPKRIANLNKLLAEWGSLEDYQQEAVLRTLLEIGAVIGLSIVSLIINGAADDEDDSYTLQAAAYITNRALLETSAMSLTPKSLLPVPYPELLEVINSPVAGTRQFQHFLDSSDLLFGGSEVEQGPYKGFTKREKFILKSIPGIKASMIMRDPKSANKFLKYKPLGWLYNTKKSIEELSEE